MKRNLVVLFTLLLVLAISSAFGQDKMKEGKVEMKMASKDKSMTIKGEVVDVSCYLAHGEKGKGEEHKGCAEACAKAGGPLGILSKNGKLYVSVMPDDHSAGPNAKLMDHIGHEVEATGMVRSHAGVNGIMITKVEMAGEGEKK
ncbi:MAG: hypothetical protein HYR76_07130 [Ignavibacteria bacterium]|nr:hypothetical protein [Ignavibacteria bacterium]MBI3765601.1 hypothetical protein [Ignavibacteriales bacterium]